MAGGRGQANEGLLEFTRADPVEVSVQKFARALTGGRASVEEQRKLGGVPEVCTVYEMYHYHLVESDAELKEIFESCKSGSLLCGECKLMGAEKLRKWLVEHHEKLKRAREEARELVAAPSF